MAGHHARELDDVQRWLPPEIHADIGFSNISPFSSAAARRHHPAVEDIAAHLAGILGRRSRRSQHPPPPPLQARRAAVSYHHHGQVCGLEGRAFDTNGGYGGNAVAWPSLPPPPPARPMLWQVTDGFDNGRFWDSGAVRRPRFASFSHRGGAPPARAPPCSGTGVFLPRRDVYLARVVKAQAYDVEKLQEELEQMQQEESMQKQKASVCPELAALPKEWTY